MNLFAYGSLMHPDVFLDVTDIRRFPRPAVLSGYRRGRLRGRNYPGIRPWTGESVRGNLFPDVTAEAWLRLDRFEGSMYRRESVAVQVEPGSWYPANAFVLDDPYAGEFLDEPWSYENFLARDLAHFRREYFGFGAVSSKDATPKP